MGAEWIDASGDEDALRNVLSRGDSASFELWDKNRLVERFRGSGEMPLP